LARALEKLEKPDDALAEYEEAVRRAPNDRLARISYGEALVRKGRIEEGLRRLQKEVELQPDEAYNHVALGSALCQVGRWEEGIQHLEEAVKLSPADRRLRAILEGARRQRLMGGPAPGAEAP
jgi:tetratricopeptide (TPR) repeat protein